MGKYLSDLQIYPMGEEVIGSRMGWEAHCVEGHYFARLGKLPTAGIWKVVVRLVGEGREIKSPYEVFDNILGVYRQFNFARYFSSSKKERKRIFLDVLHYSLLDAAEKFCWNRDLLINAYQRVLAEDIDLWGRWKRRIANPRRKLYAQIVYHYDSDKLTLYVAFYDREDNELDQVLLTSTDEPWWSFVLSTLGKIEWVDDVSVRVTSKDGERSWVVGRPH